jgi:hypothetical protein
MATNIRFVIGRDLWRRLRKRRSKPPLLEIAAKATLSTLDWGGPLNQIITGLQQRRKYAAETALGAISERVGWDVIQTIVEGNPEIEAMLWTALNAITMTGVDSKRKVLQNVVANAMVSDEPIDIEQLKVAVLAELDAPHIRALARLSEAQWLDGKHPPPQRRDNKGNDLSALATVAKREPTPVLAALIRTGVVYPGGMVMEDGLGFAPSAGELTVGGVTVFGEDLLEDLRAESPDGLSPWQAERAGSRRFLKELRRTFEGKS